MPGGSYIQVYVRCPFYHSDKVGKQIICEGLIDGCSLTLHYMQKSDWLNHIQGVCCEQYEKCDIYRMLMETKYPAEYWESV